MWLSSSHTVPKSKAYWTPDLHKVFVDICLEQVNGGNRPGTYFTREGWMNIVELFHERTGISYDRKQMKSHWDVMREQWKVWCKLTGTGFMKWDRSSNKFGATEKEWALYVKANPAAAQFQFKELQFVDKLEIIFDGAISKTDAGLLTPCRHKGGSVTSPLQTEGQAITMKAPKIEAVHELDISSGSDGDLDTYSETSPGRQNSCLPALKPKAKWTPDCHKIFVDLCTEQTLKGNECRMYLTEEGWRHVIRSFNLKTGLSLDKKQLENHWDLTKQQWSIWCKLVGDSRMKWDPNTKRFGATEDDWNNYIQENPESAQFRYKELYLTDQLEVLFGGRRDSREPEPPRKHRRLNVSSITSTVHTAEPEIAKSELRKEHLSDAVESRSTATMQRNAASLATGRNKLNYSIGECIECLDEMDNVEQGSDLYLFALEVFLKREYREIFLQLKKPSVRIAWLQRLQSVDPSID
ncbi:L10-interacting MYB domain-containing protein [Syzygium oleosum]|uniref:L10-interacting MYB domain-containing protein n=1 Tax=Syzygium oleosum TaxID=219896 RepID=UPI0011D21DF8|nr:L10-interacting MYB domain-containing protein [Syzygium oleosum]XP_030451297.1 L10-interacting MYB domain-containing protein [Syzygium oleosum]XP_056164828.1 L10-interacting MYB domain-containing protein [Syzygium oleosum]